jgi:hypothetical protein
MAKQIAKYDAAWHPDMHRGVIFFQFSDGGRGRLDASDAGEFCAVISILRHESPLITSKGWIGTGLEHADEAVNSVEEAGT